MNLSEPFYAIDLFAGCGGLTLGMKQAGFAVTGAVEINPDAVETYCLNNTDTQMIAKDIRLVKQEEITQILNKQTLHLLAGCPPCQGFSSIRRLNRSSPITDNRNDLIAEYSRLIKELRPLTIMMENVPALVDFPLFQAICGELKNIGYFIDYEILNVKDFEVPQSRKRLVMVGSLLGELKVKQMRCEKINVREALSVLEQIEATADPVHQIRAGHTPRIQDLISRIPKDGGSRKDLPTEFILDCHKKEKVGFNDVYGRLSWEKFSTTITGGCLNPSKGRFLHPAEDRCISAREASLLQTFPIDYKFKSNIAKTSIALLIGNALPPRFSFHQCQNIYSHLSSYSSK